MNHVTNIIICGDLCPTKDTQLLFEKQDHNLLFNDILPIFNNSDFILGNLEFVLTDNPIPIEKTGPILHGKTSYINLFQKAGFNALSLANNHIKDCGEEGVKSTISTIDKSNILHFGAGKNLSEAKKPLITVINGVKIAYITFAEQEFNVASENEYGSNYFDPYEDIELIYQTKKEVDFLFVIYHGGIEYYEYPSPLLQKKCRKFIDSGADLVTCQHSHCIGTIEDYKERKIIYGQGNTVFGYREGDNSWNQGLIIKIILSKNGKLDVNFQGITAIQEGGIRLMDDKENQVLQSNLLERSKKVNDPMFIEENWKRFCISKSSLYLPQYLALNRYFIHLNRLLKNSFVSLIYGKKYLRSSHNIIRCEAHNEVLQTILESKLKEEL